MLLIYKSIQINITTVDYKIEKQNYWTCIKYGHNNNDCWNWILQAENL